MTLWPFQHVVCFATPHERVHVAPRCSTAYCLHVLCVAALITLPVFAAFASDSVWIKENFYREQPVVSFANDVVVTLVGATLSDAVGWGSRADMDALLPQEVRVPAIRSAAVDANMDGLADSLTLSLEMPIGNLTGTIQSVKLLAVYNVELREKVSERMQALVAIDISNPYPAFGVRVHGQLSLRQKLPLRMSSEVRDVYDQNPLLINWTSNWAFTREPLMMHALLERYVERSETVTFESLVPPAWDYTPKEKFIVKVVLEVPPQIVYYVPGLLEVLKFAWIQVFSFLAPLWFILRMIKAFAFNNQIVETYVVLPNPAKVS